MRQFYGAVRAAKALPQRVKLPPAPKVPTPPSGMVAGAADALGSVLGIETAHQRAMKAHAEAMKQWRQTVKDLCQLDAKAWEQLEARSAIAPIAQKQQKAASPQARPLPSVIPVGIRTSKGPR